MSKRSRFASTFIWQIFVALIAVAFGLCDALLVNHVAAQEPLDFEAQIAPIFATHCVDCHGPDEAEAGLRLDRPSALNGGDSGEPLIVPGDPNSGRLMQVLVDPKSDVIMPPDGEKLSDAEIELLRQWIASGGVWPPSDLDNEAAPLFWSFQPLQPTPAPTVGPNDDRGPIDRWIAEAQRQRGIVPVGAATRQDWLQRASLIVTGLRPDSIETHRFQIDDRPDAQARQIDRLLASPAFGERWARHWLDVVRFAETSGFETNVARPDAYPFRDWVIGAFNDDLPVDRFVHAQLAGDSSGDDVATSFLVGGPWDQVKSSDPVLTATQRQDELADMINTTGTAFLGLTLGCARCHNHKFDPVTQRDYYALQAVLAGVQHGSRPFDPQVDPEQRRRRVALEKRVAELETQLQQLEAPNSPRVTYGTRVIDDRASVSGAVHEAVAAGEGELVAGHDRGAAADPGSASRVPTLGQTYSWWQNQPGEPVISFPLATEGIVRVWASWGVGWQTHTNDAQYWLDLDGDWQSSSDRSLIATVDQQKFSEGTETPFGATRSSGWLDLGLIEVLASSRLFLVCGQTGTAITCDALVIEPVSAADEQIATPTMLPIRPPVASTGVELRFPKVLADRVRMTITQSNASEPCIDELEVWAADGSINVALAQQGGVASSTGDLQGYPIHRLEHLNDGLFGNDHSWISATAGAGQVEIGWPQATWVDRITWGRDREGRFGDRTAERWTIEVATADGVWIPVADERSHAPKETVSGPWRVERFAMASPADKETADQIYLELNEAQAELSQAASPMNTVYAGTFSTPPTIYRLYRGDAMQPREEIEPGVPEFLAGMVSAPNLAGKSEAERRAGFADWLVSEEQALPWRVMSNRLWQYVFGRGLVSTPSDFGRNGSINSNPELLEYLAFELREDRSAKLLLRKMLTSAAFARSSTPDPGAAAVDVEATTLWRFTPRRLEAEAIRDSMLDAVGRLDRRMGGPGFSAFKPNDNYVRNYQPLENYGPETFRRMVYMTKVRSQQDAIFGLFDVPDAGQVCPRRGDSTSPLQALNLFNSPFVLDQSSELVRAMQAEVGSDQQAGIEWMFQQVVKRVPSDVEFAASSELVNQYGWNALARALWNTNEFLTIP